MTTAAQVDAIAKLAAEIAMASQALEEANKANAETSRHQTGCTNRLNEAQRLFDKAVAELRTSAPYYSDWSKKK